MDDERVRSDYAQRNRKQKPNNPLFLCYHPPPKKSQQFLLSIFLHCFKNTLLANIPQNLYFFCAVDFCEFNNCFMNFKEKKSNNTIFS